MIPKLAPGYNQIRQRLADIVPLSTPFTLFVTPSQLCNFRCHYCTQSLDRERKKKVGFRSQLQDQAVFMKIAEQAAEFPVRFKRVLLTGLGEPLTNPAISDMVATLATLQVAEKYEIFTNASLLTPSLSDRLLAAGLTGLRISIQGLSSERYREISGVKLDFDRFVENIRYFYRNRGSCTVYIKIIDQCLGDEQDRDSFFNLFGEMCDSIFIEHLVRAQPSMGDYDHKADNELTFYGEEAETRLVCPYMFYTLQTDALGNVFPCPPLGLPLDFSLGNVGETRLIDIWEGTQLRNLRLAHLTKCRERVPMCGRCGCYMSFTPREDNLDQDAEAIIERVQAPRQRASVQRGQ
jgi:MoaA/NifB/PqqE/SkfB family radical SAM enzyme